MGFYRPIKCLWGDYTAIRRKRQRSADGAARARDSASGDVKAAAVRLRRAADNFGNGFGLLRIKGLGSKTTHGKIYLYKV